MPQEFHATNTFGNFLAFDDNARSLLLIGQRRIVGYDEIAGFRYEEEHGPMGKGGIARAFTSNFLGDAGEYTLTAMRIGLTLRAGEEPLFVDLIVTPVKSTTLIYRNLKATADAILKKLAEVAPKREEDETSPYAYTEEIRRLGGLRDEGIITEEEFQVKKKQLLGI